MASSLGKMPTTSVRRFDLAVEALDRIRAVKLCPMLFREGHVGENVRLGIIEDGGELRHLRPDLVGDGAPLSTCDLERLLREGGGDEGGDHAPAALAGMGQHVPHEVDAIALPCRRQNPGGGALEALVGIGDDDAG